MSYLQSLAEVVFPKEVGQRLKDQYINDVQKLGQAIINESRNKATRLLIFDHAEILDLGEKEGNVHAVELKRWLQNIKFVSDSVKILLISEKSQASWKGGIMRLDAYEKQQHTKKGAYKYFGKQVTFGLLEYYTKLLSTLITKLCLHY